MRFPKWISAQDLDGWAATPQAKFTLPHILRRLVYATVSQENLQKIDFKSGAEVSRHGYDGITVIKQATTFVPEGISFWESGCEVNSPKRKAQEDYDKRVENNRARVSSGEVENLKESTFIAVTAVDWHDAESWAEKMSKEGHFKKVIAYDSNNLEQWLEIAPAVSLWLAQQIRGRRDGVVDISGHWANVQGILRRPLPPEVLLVNRDEIKKTFSEWLDRPNGELAVKAPSVDELVAVFCAWVHTLAPDKQDEISSRTIIVEERETWRALATSKNALVLIPSPRLALEPELVTEAIRQGHHVLRFAEFRTRRSLARIELPKMRRFDLQEVLHTAGLTEPEAAQLAESAGGNFTILRRRFSQTQDSIPEWAKEGSLAPILLAAAWEDARESDQNVIRNLTGKDYVDVRCLLTAWRQKPDPPVRLALGAWEFLSPLDAWEALHPFITTAHMDAYEEVAVQVLSEDDPALELPPEQRFMAAVKGKVWKFSQILRRGIAEILALGATREEESCVGNELVFRSRAASIVSRILPAGCSWQRWASLGEELSLLIEAAPDAVLEAMERDLASGNPQLVELMRQEFSGGPMGAAYHSGVLWSLEVAGWQPDRLKSVALCLTRLSKLDPGGTFGNRPLASVGRIFFSRWPQTLASLGERLDALHYVCKKEPAGAWKLLTELLPVEPGFVMANAKPTYRDWAAGWVGDIGTVNDEDFQGELMGMALNLVGKNPSLWVEMLERLPRLPENDLRKALSALEGLTAEQSETNGVRVQMWEKLHRMVQDHTHFHRSWQSFSLDDLTRLAAVRDRLAPADLIATSKYLFDDDGHHDGSETQSFDEKIFHRGVKRRGAMRDIWRDKGLVGVVALAEQARQPWSVGWSLAEEMGDDPQGQILPRLLTDAKKGVAVCARAFAAQRIHVKGVEWGKVLPSNDWLPSQVAALGLQMPFAPATWDWIASKGQGVEKLYWSETGVWGYVEIDTIASVRAVKQLQAIGRPWSALQHLIFSVQNKRIISPVVFCDVLDNISKNPQEIPQSAVAPYNIHEAFKILQQSEQIETARVEELEFIFLPFLDRHSRLPFALQRKLARDPQFFIDCLKVLYRPRQDVKEETQSGKKKEVVTDPDLVARAERIWNLLRDWQIIPGTTTEGTVSDEVLHEWVRSARQIARAADRLEVCDINIGQLFARSHEDTDKAKPLSAIREIIEECESEEIDRGFHIGLKNLRGVTSRGLYEGGDQERKLAAHYQNYANICSHWPRTQKTLRSVAEDYLRQAAAEDERAKARD